MEGKAAVRAFSAFAAATARTGGGGVLVLLWGAGARDYDMGVQVKNAGELIDAVAGRVMCSPEHMAVLSRFTHEAYREYLDRIPASSPTMPVPEGRQPQ